MFLKKAQKSKERNKKINESFPPNKSLLHSSLSIQFYSSLLYSLKSVFTIREIRTKLSQRLFLLLT